MRQTLFIYITFSGIIWFITDSVSASTEELHADAISVDYSVTATVDDSMETLQGEVKISFRWKGKNPLEKLGIWLFPNLFDHPPPWIDDRTKPWVYPAGFSEGRMELTEIKRGSRKTPLDSVEYMAHPADDLGNNSDRITAFVPLNPPVMHGDSGKITIKFSLEIPEKTGRLGRYADVLSLASDWFPRLTAISADGTVLFEHLPAESQYSISMNMPSSFHAVIGTKYVHPESDHSARSVHFSQKTAVPPPVVLFRKAETQEQDSPHRVRLVAMPTSCAPVGDSTDRQDPVSYDIIDDLSCYDRFERLFKVISSGLDFMAARGLKEPTNTPFVVMEIPLRTHLTGRFSGGIIISDRLYDLVDLESALHFHDFQVLRSLFTHLAWRMTSDRENDQIRHWVAEFLGFHWTQEYYRNSEESRDSPEDILGWLSFIPAVDQFLYGGWAQFRESYFSPVLESDTPREAPWNFNNHNPSGRLLYEKAADLVGKSSLRRAVSHYASGKNNLVHYLEREAGENLDWFFEQWKLPYPAMNYRIADTSSVLMDYGKYRHRAVIKRDGEQVREPVEVAFFDNAGNQALKKWDGRGSEGTVEWMSEAGLKKVEIDPDSRLVEDYELASNHPRSDNATSHPMRAPVLSKIMLSAEAVEGIPLLEALFVVRRENDLHHSLLLGAEYQVRGGGVDLTYLYYWGPKRNKDSLRWFAGPFIKGFRYRGTFGASEKLKDEEIPGTSFEAGLLAGYDNRYYFFDPKEGIGASLAVSSINTFLDNGETLSGGRTTGRVFNLFPLAFRHTLALYGQAGISFGELLPSQISNISGKQALRGFESDETAGRAAAFAALEYRHVLFEDVDINLARLIWLERLQGVLFVAGGTTSGTDNYGGMFSTERLFAEAGYGLRFHVLWLGAQQGLLGIDLAVPVHPLDRFVETQSGPRQRQSFGIHISSVHTF